MRHFVYPSRGHVLFVLLNSVQVGNVAILQAFLDLTSVRRRCYFYRVTEGINRRASIVETLGDS